MTRTQEMRKMARAKAEEARKANEAGDVKGARALLDEAMAISEHMKISMAQEEREGKDGMSENIVLNAIQTAVPEKVAASDPDIVTLAQGEFQALVERTRSLELQLKRACVKDIIDRSLARGVPPAVVSVAERVLMACEPDAQATIKLSDDAPNPVNLFGAVVALVESVPGRIGERTYGPTNGKPPIGLSGEEKPITLEEAEKQARECRIKLGLTAAVADAMDIEL